MWVARDLRKQLGIAYWEDPDPAIARDPEYKIPLPCCAVALNLVDLRAPGLLSLFELIHGRLSLDEAKGQGRPRGSFCRR